MPFSPALHMSGVSPLQGRGIWGLTAEFVVFVLTWEPLGRLETGVRTLLLYLSANGKPSEQECHSWYLCFGQDKALVTCCGFS